ncbi:MAG: hypothetical protein KJ052_17240 [Candidatus Hydrogenedentes bacterium]|nr:hypothetical protein [Candidatus Hydrogenedentota bacterium]
MLVRDPRSLAWKVRLFRERFAGLEHIYGTYDPVTGKSWQVKKPVDDLVVKNHLFGRMPYGVYLLIGDRTRLAVADFDSHDANAPLAFVDVCKRYGINAYIEASKSKGFHVWIFFTAPGVLAAKARAVMHHILDEAECGAVEVFPKQDRIDVHAGQSGSFINAALYGRNLHEGRTVFLDPANGLAPYPNQWSVLEHVETVTQSLLEEIMEVNGISSTFAESPSVTDKTIGTWESARGLPPCARRMFAEGVVSLQRLSCFRLAVHLRRIGIPYDIAVAALVEWSGKNRPAPGKQVISIQEIKAQTAHAYNKEYQGNGCDQAEVLSFCASSCPIYPVVEAQRRGKV